MTRDFKESDWKILRELFPVALEQFSRRILDEIKTISADDLRSSHERYLAIFETIRRRDEEMAQMFNDIRRSTAFFQLASIQSNQLLKEDEFLRFSPETRSSIELLLGEKT